MFQLQSIARTYATSQKYDITFQALRSISDLTARYLILRNGNLVMPTSLSGLLGNFAPPHDAFLTEQLESFATLHKTAVKVGDIELSRQIIEAMLSLSLRGLNIQTLSQVPGENSVSNLVLGYLQGAVEQGTVQNLDDIALNGCRAMGSIGKAATQMKLYLNNHLVVGGLEKIASLGVIQRKAHVTREALTAIGELTWVAIRVGLRDTHTIGNALETEKRIAMLEVSIPNQGLAGSLYVQSALGPFLDPASETAVARLEALAIQCLVASQREGEPSQPRDAASVIEELNDRLWLQFAEIGVAAAKTESFALHFINANVSEIANQQLKLIEYLREHEISGLDQWQKQRFLKQLIHDFQWLVSGVHWRIYDAFTSPIKTHVVWEFFTSLSQLGIRCVEIGLTGEANGVIANLGSMAKKALSVQIDHGYGPPRIAEHIARIGIIAQKLDREEILRSALSTLREFQKAYAERVKRAEQLQGQLIYEIRELDRRRQERQFLMGLDAHFFIRLAAGDVDRFVALLLAELGKADSPETA
jgi:hypothetical protein